MLCNSDKNQKHSVVTGEFVNAKTNISDTFSINDNYPNPVNPTTTIEFMLLEAGNAELSVYNVSGQKVRALVSEMVSPGIHTVEWDGRDELGSPVSSGVYISRLTMGGHSVSRRMTLVK